MFTLEITASAEDDLDQITDYLGTTLANPPAATAFLRPCLLDFFVNYKHVNNSRACKLSDHLGAVAEISLQP
jgi:hypothetical protein